MTDIPKQPRLNRSAIPGSGMAANVTVPAILWHPHPMPLNEEDLGKIARLLLPLEQRADSLEEAMHARFDQVHEALDNLYTRDEKREHEYLVLREQVA